MVKIRLSRGGSKKKPFYHIVVTDSRNPRDGKYIERLGYFNPGAGKNEDDISINSERLDYWKSVGSQISDRVLHLIKISTCLLYTSPSPRDGLLSRMPSSA